MAKRTYSEPGEYEAPADVQMAKAHQPKKTNKKQLICAIAVVGVLCIVAIVCLIFAFKEKREDAQIVNLWNDIKQVATDTPSDIPTTPAQKKTETKSEEPTAVVVAEDGTQIVLTEAYSENPMGRVINWDKLLDINKDVKCWIYIPGTGVDYPVMQEQEFAKAYYLNHNIYKVAQKSGAIFTPKEPNDNVTDVHMLFYGHHMKNGSMFGIITNYKKKEFCDEHPFIYIYYPDRTEKWGIWTVNNVLDEDDVYLMPYFDGTIEYKELLKSLEETSLYETEYFGVDDHTKTITLSTCDHSVDANTGRFIVNAVWLESIEPGSVEESNYKDDMIVDDMIDMTVDDSDYSGYELDETELVEDESITFSTEGGVSHE